MIVSTKNMELQHAASRNVVQCQTAKVFLKIMSNIMCSHMQEDAVFNQRECES